jgi:hypothetical protein
MALQGGERLLDRDVAMRVLLECAYDSICR